MFRRIPGIGCRHPPARGREHQHQGTASVLRSRAGCGQCLSAISRCRRAPDDGEKHMLCRGLAAKATAAVLEVQVIQARHIAESDDAAMSRMESEMAASEAAAGNAARRLERPAPARRRASTRRGGRAALDRFKTINAELVTLSRRNSNVRSLALSLGRKRTVTADATIPSCTRRDPGEARLHGDAIASNLERRTANSNRERCPFVVRFFVRLQSSVPRSNTTPTEK